MIIALTILLILVIAAGLVWECFRTGITRMYTLWPALLYVLLNLACPEAYSAWQAQLAVAGIMLLTLRLDRTYLASHVQEVCFADTLLLLLGSFVYPTLYIYIPILWLALMYQQSFSGKACLASLIAVGVFFIWYGIYLYLSGHEPMIHLPQFGLPEMGIVQLVVVGILVLITFYLLLCIYWRFGRTSRRRRFMTNLHLAYFLPALALTIFSQDGAADLPLMIYPICILAVLYQRRND